MSRRKDNKMNIAKVTRGLKSQVSGLNLNINPVFLSRLYKPITQTWLMDSYIELYPSNRELIPFWYEGGCKIFGFHFKRICENKEDFLYTKTLINDSMQVVDNSINLNKLRGRGIKIEHFVEAINKDTGEFSSTDRELIVRVWISLCTILYYGNMVDLKKKPNQALVVTLRNIFRRAYGSFEIKHTKEVKYSQLHKINSIVKMFEELGYILRAPIISNYNSLGNDIENARKKYLVCRKGVMSKVALNELANENTKRWIQRQEESKLQLSIYE